MTPADDGEIAMGEGAEPTLLAIADELYALPLAEFTPARDARAKELKGTDLAKPVKALRKPSLAAWVVNLFVRRDAEQVAQVLAVGAALREAQAGMSGDELRALTKQRRQLTAAVTQQARSLAHEEGTRLTQAVADQVEATLTAAMVSERCGEAVRSGLLVGTLATTGVDDLDPTDLLAVPEALGHVATPTGPDGATGATGAAGAAGADGDTPAPPQLHVVPDPDAAEKARAAAQEQLDEAEAAVVVAQVDRDEAVLAVEELEARQLQLESQIEELKRRIAELEETYDEVDDDLGDAEDARTSATEAFEAATADRDAAAAALAALS